VTPPYLVPSFQPVHGPPVPKQGAYLGAWPHPSDYTIASYIAAADEMRASLGRRLDIITSYRRWDQPFFTQSDEYFFDQGYYELFSWAHPPIGHLDAGEFDGFIRDKARLFKEMGKPIFLRWRWEMDRPNLRAEVGGPKQFVADWRHMHDLFAAEGVHNVGWVWCPTSAGFRDGTAQRYYPGDDYVDWICVDAYPYPKYQPMSQLLAPFLDWAKTKNKPIMIGEYGAPKIISTDARAKWLAAADATFRRYRQIRAVCYFDADPPGLPPIQRVRISDDERTFSVFKEMARSPYYDQQHLLDGGGS